MSDEKCNVKLITSQTHAA